MIVKNPILFFLLHTSIAQSLFQILKKLLLLFFISLCMNGQSQPSFSPIEWEHKFPGSNGKVIKMDFDGNLLVVGRAAYGSIIAKIDTSGNIIWQDICNDQFYLLHDMDIDSIGNVYFTGYIYDTTLSITGNPFLIKYNSLGIRQWVKVIESGKAFKIKVFNENHIYITGIRDSTYINPPVLWRAFTACFDSSGNRSWYFLDSSNYETNSYIIELDKSGNSYIAGYTACCLPGYDFFVTKLDINGTMIWSNNYSNPNINYTTPRFSTIDDSANLYISGIAIVAGGVPYDCLVAKVDSTGNLEWWNFYSQNFGTNKKEYTSDLLCDKNGNLYVAGYIQDFTFSPMRQDGFIAKFTSSGQLSWTYIYNKSNNASADFLGCISLINDSIVIGAGSGIYSATGGGLVVLALNTSGQFLTKLETDGVFTAIDVVKNNSSLYFNGTRIDNSLAGTAYDSMMVFKVNYFANTLLIHEFSKEQILSVYPNPFSQKIKITVSAKSPIKSIKLFNYTGKLAHTDIVNDSSMQLNCAFLPSGLYLLEVTDSEGNVNRKKLLKSD